MNPELTAAELRACARGARIVAGAIPGAPIGLTRWQIGTRDAAGALTVLAETDATPAEIEALLAEIKFLETP